MYQVQYEAQKAKYGGMISILVKMLFLSLHIPVLLKTTRSVKK